MMIKVRTLTGKLIEFDVEPTDTIEDVKKRVEEKEGILPAQQRLIYSGKQMHDDVKLGEGGVVPDATLHLVLTLRGGAGPRHC
ncbi:hypothetical protein GGS24DRAFT_495240 [Hypoxylon argillaceum]|nr:hypothetical protein GGS24DRAFT_495240 [Hypoxylon argillaceum]KAI1152151.1 hypothetical protein F4825DRAFT_420075 [Nemania diffusa]